MSCNTASTINQWHHGWHAWLIYVKWTIRYNRKHVCSNFRTLNGKEREGYLPQIAVLFVCLPREKAVSISFTGYWKEIGGHFNIYSMDPVWLNNKQMKHRQRWSLYRAYSTNPSFSTKIKKFNHCVFVCVIMCRCVNERTHTICVWAPVIRHRNVALASVSPSQGLVVL